MSHWTVQSRRWSLRETLIVAVLRAVFAVLYLAWVQVWLVSQAAFGPVAMDVVMGFWFSASVVAAALTGLIPGAVLADVSGAIRLKGVPIGERRRRNGPILWRSI